MNYKKILRIGLFWIGICFVLWLAVHSWESIQGSLRSVNWLLFCLSVIVALISNIVASAIFWNLLLKHNVDVGFRRTIKLFLMGQIAKYIPGKVWVIAHQVSSLQKEGVALGVAMANIELMMIIVIMVSLISIALIASFSSIPAAVLILFVGVFVVWMFIKNNLLSWGLRLFPRLGKNEGEVKNAAGAAFGFWGVASCYMAFIILYLASYVLMLNSVFGFSHGESAVYIAALSLAWVVGLAAFIVPGGIGVREVLFMVIAGAIGQGVDASVLASIAVISRAWLIVQDFMGVGVALLLGKSAA